METGYKTVKAEGSTTFKEKKSEFIGTIAPITTEEEAKEFIDKISTKYKDASHNVYAYILKGGQVKRYSDNGEPQGTAGLPALGVFEKENIVDVCVVITRYFGGTELGTGGLRRAYSKSAKLSLDEVGIAVMELCVEFTVSCGYDFYEKFLQIIPSFNINIINTEFLEEVNLTMYILKDKFDEFSDKLTMLSNGKLTANIIKESFADVNIFSEVDC